jgi:hypothetical protein
MPSDTADSTRQFESAEAIAQAIGCTEFQQIENEESLAQIAEESSGQLGADLAESMLSAGVKSWGGCEIDGNSIEITTFEGAPYVEEGMTDDSNVINTGGAVPVYGSNWSLTITDVATFDRATEEEVAMANAIIRQIGGRIQY